jgi:hypothetical protein
MPKKNLAGTFLESYVNRTKRMYPGTRCLTLPLRSLSKTRFDTQSMTWRRRRRRKTREDMKSRASFRRTRSYPQSRTLLGKIWP